MAISYNSYLQNCRDDDVIILSNKLCKLGDLTDQFDKFLSSTISCSLRNDFESQNILISDQMALELLSDGTDAEILKIASDGWKKGKLKIKVTLEFIPEPADPSEYQSPLDEIRREIQERKLM